MAPTPSKVRPPEAPLMVIAVAAWAGAGNPTSRPTSTTSRPAAAGQPRVLMKRPSIVGRRPSDRGDRPLQIGAGIGRPQLHRRADSADAAAVEGRARTPVDDLVAAAAHVVEPPLLVV